MDEMDELKAMCFNSYGSEVKFRSITQDAEKEILHCARVSSKNPDAGGVGLINYLIKHGHWSPFEMATMSLEIKTSRSISRQIIRHRSFSFQEFSQRYENPQVLSEQRIHWEARLEHEKNRQSSVRLNDDDPKKAELQKNFDDQQDLVWDTCMKAYMECLKQGIAREQARALLPEGLVCTRVQMMGNIRSWIHYIQLRSAPDTQQEHRVIAEIAMIILSKMCPHIAKALKWNEHKLGEDVIRNE